LDIESFKCTHNFKKENAPQNIIGTKILAGSFGADTDINIYYGVAN